MTYQDIHGWFSWEALYSRMVNMFPNGATFIEIGTYLGKSACYMASKIKESGKDIDFYCIDPFDIDVSGISVREQGGSWLPLFLDNVKRLGLRAYIIPMCVRNLEAVKHFVRNGVDFVFIDAEHDYASVRNDIKTWVPIIKPGGVVAGHDYTTNQDTKRAVDDFFGNRVINEGECWLVNL